jgi:hypothetical protein
VKKLYVIREPSTDVETMGRLQFDGNEIYCVEQEWRPTAPGGEPNNSCVPAGTYDLIPHTRPNGDKVVALVNPGLGVYYQASDRTRDVGRYLILIHAGNTSKDVIGCIAPGLGRSGQMVTSSRAAMKKIMDYIGDDKAQIIIR